MPPGSPNPDPISDKTMSFSTPAPFSDLAFREKLCHHGLYYSANNIFLQMHFQFAYFYFVLIQLELTRKIRSYTPVVPSKTIPESRPKWAKHIPVFRPKRTKNPTVWGGTYYGLYKGVLPPPPPPPPPPPSWLFFKVCFFFCLV